MARSRFTSGAKNQPMNTFIKNLFLLAACVAGFGLATAAAPAQAFRTLHSFDGGDANAPWAGLVLSSNTLYGTGSSGGSLNHGAVFALNSDGAGFTNLHSFDGDRASPRAGVIVSGNTLYGTTLYGGSSDWGAVFAVNTDGTGFTNLHSFTAPSDGTNSDGVLPTGELILSGNTLYGTAQQAGSRGRGAIFRINTDGTGFTNLYDFTQEGDGAGSYAGLILSSNTLFGTTRTGGSFGGGTVFKVNTDGTGFTNVYAFSQGNDGAAPVSGVILSGNTLYGTAYYGGSSGNGTVFAVNTDGTGFTLLHTFTALSGGANTNSDGAAPNAGLILSGNTLLGTVLGGGHWGYGTVFAVNTDGTGFTTLHHFTGGSDGGNPAGDLSLSGTTLYGTTLNGGSPGYGTVFSLSLLPQLAIVRSGATIVLTWPTHFAGFDYTRFALQSTTNLVSPVVWSTNSLPPVVVNGQNTVTNPASGPKEFYRLNQ